MTDDITHVTHVTHVAHVTHVTHATHVIYVSSNGHTHAGPRDNGSAGRGGWTGYLEFRD